MKTSTKFLRVLAVAAAVALPSHALADGHDKPGFYIGGGGHLNNAEFAFSKAFAANAVTLVVTDIAGTSHTGSATAAFEDLDITLVVASTSSISFTADDKSAFGFGVHGGYRINKHFAVEGSYAILGEFTSNYTYAVVPGTLTFVSGATTLSLTALTGKYTAEATAISGAALGMYPLADNATVFGKLGYYSMSVDESLNSVAASTGTSYTAVGHGEITSGNISINHDPAGDTSGFLFGGGVEMKFGRQQNILVRAEFEMLSGAIAEDEAMTRFGVTGSYSF